MANGLMRRGATPVFAEDALAADNQTAHAGALQSLAEHYGKVVSTAEITAIWSASVE